MDNQEATSYLSQFIGQPLRIHTSDGRVFGGQMKCTDKVRPAATFTTSQIFSRSCRTQAVLREGLYHPDCVLIPTGPQYHPRPYL